MNQYRCTRFAPYQHDCIGRDDTSAREGYYVFACNVEHAKLAMWSRFPQEGKLNLDAAFTADLIAGGDDDAPCEACKRRRAAPEMRLGARVRVSGTIVRFCQEPNTGLAVVEIANPDRDRAWQLTIPLVCLEAL